MQGIARFSLRRWVSLSLQKHLRCVHRADADEPMQGSRGDCSSCLISWNSLQRHSLLNHGSHQHCHRGLTVAEACALHKVQSRALGRQEGFWSARLRNHLHRIWWHAPHLHISAPFDEVHCQVCVPARCSIHQRCLALGIHSIHIGAVVNQQLRHGNRHMLDEVTGGGVLFPCNVVLRKQKQRDVMCTEASIGKLHSDETIL
mmetsp:Transcript_70537/g.168968  ORF Transcript_70537/g.168968 Transcript_70537/m.168968 type:complete len:202 (+) Transcript_70537:409-1014(+)